VRDQFAPTFAGNAKPAREVGDASVEAGRAASQMGWYRLAAKTIVPGRSVLDAGCGLGAELDELARTASQALGQELDPRLARDGVTIGPVEAIPDKSYDIVVSVDVVEHVPDDAAFIANLARIARIAVFVTTPLSFHGRPIWPYHIREYRASQFLHLLAPFGRLTYFIGSPSGSEIYPVRSMVYFNIIDGLVNSPVTNLPFRAFQKLLPKRLRYHAHQGALIHIA
jgi:SAM-dependent methyltransferase